MGIHQHRRKTYPKHFFGKALRKLQPELKDEDIFTTNYKMNSSRTIRRLFRETNFEHFIYSWNPEPAYFGKSKLLAWLMKSVFEIIPEAFGSTLLIFLRKRGSEQQESFR